MNSMNIFLRFGINLKWKHLKIITIYTQNAMFYSLLMCLRNFEITVWLNYTLCRIHYLKAPGVSWNAILDMTKVELDLISDVDLYLLLEKGTRDGVS